MTKILFDINYYSIINIMNYFEISLNPNIIWRLLFVFVHMMSPDPSQFLIVEDLFAVMSATASCQLVCCVVKCVCSDNCYHSNLVRSSYQQHCQY